jgi:hypothetical protein
MPARGTYERHEAVDHTYRDPDTPVVVRDEAYDASVERPGVAAEGPAFSPAQFVALVVGIGFTVLGAVAVAQTGFDPDHIYTPVERVWSFGHTPLFGVIEIGFGLLMIAAAVVPGGARTLMGLLGAAALVFGIVTLADAAQEDLTEWLGVTDRTGWLYIITGAVTLLAAMLSPVFFPTTRRERVTSVRRTAS